MYLRQAASNFVRRIPKLPSRIFCSSGDTTINASPLPLFCKIKFSNQYGFGSYMRRKNQEDSFLWILLFGQAATLLGINSTIVLTEDVSIQSSSQSDLEGSNAVGLTKIEDGSVISNIHTSKWRVFTDNGRDFFMQGKMEEAEKFFLSALQEAKEGFGERDPHVASACNNLAELYRVTKGYDKAEPLYLEAINILESSFGPEDIRVGVAYHNLGQFYLVQRKLEDACRCYEHALKIKGRVLGHGNVDYADTMYHLGMVFYLQGNEKDCEALFQDSIRILEDAGQGESMTCIRRLRYLSQIYMKANRLEEAENVQRKILHIMELSKGWNSMETVISAERLALTLQSTGSLREAQELFERCLDARKSLLSPNHVQISANMLHIARVAMLNSNQLRKRHASEAIAELDRAKELLDNSIRIARHVLSRSMKHKGEKDNYGASGETRRDRHAALVILLQSLQALGLLEITKQEMLETQFATEKSISASPEVKAEYLSCLKHLSSLIGDANAGGRHKLREPTLQELKDEIKRLEVEVSSKRR
ncbi:uncharacterized protein LOC123197259 isoform X2 [Mangifera indica]|uniref:uncharacterized protein LOC123197259 isoform X2 n=1 Tax=Mangifera indica TaxID=29780 RepID=UPI001CF9F2F9|nr:uncharacterized protein LOC123197259 isoform X2 [Mangifera indica]